MSARIDRIGLLAGLTRLRAIAAVTIVAAVVMTWLAAGQAQRVAALAREAGKPPPEARTTVNRRYYGERDYDRIVEALRRNNPGVEFEVARGGTHLKLKVKERERFDAWVFALYGLQGYGGNVAWEAETLCLGKCADGAAALAQVKAFTQDIRKN